MADNNILDTSKQLPPPPPMEEVEHSDAAPHPQPRPPLEPELQRIRHLPDWETPLHPPNNKRRDHHRRRPGSALFSRLPHIAIPKPPAATVFKNPVKFTTREKKPPAGPIPISQRKISAPFAVSSPTTPSTTGAGSMSMLNKETMGFPSPSPNASRTLLPIHNNQYNQNLRQTTPPATSPSSLPVAEKSPTTANSSTKDKLASITTTLKSKFDTLLPPDKTYIFGLPRRRFLLFVILPISLLLLLVFILALGLGIGLHRPSSELPLPWNDTPGKEWKGDLTYYSPALGACGYNNTDADAVVAVAWSVYDAAAAEGNGNPNENPLCGRKIRVWITEGDEDGGVNVTVMDRCTGCEVTDLDLSPGVFGLLADEAEGRVKGRWRWLP